MRHKFKDPHSVHSQFVRYFVVASATLILDILFLFLMVHFLDIHYLVAATIAYIASMLVNYAISVRWVFADRSERSKNANFALFMLIGIVGLLLTDLVMWVLTERLALYYLASKLLSICIVFFWSFLARRKLFAPPLSSALSTS